MVSPTKRTSAQPSDQTYHAVPTNAQSPDANLNSPNPNDPYTSLSPANPSDQYLSPELSDAALLRRDSYLPAPSIISRDSTHASLPGTPPLQHGNRDSWGSGTGLAAAAGGIAGAPTAPSYRRASQLPSSRLGYNNTTLDDDDDEQGHITPAVAGIGAGAAAGGLSEKPRWAQESESAGPGKKSRRGLWIGLGAGAILLLAGLGVGLGVGLTRNRSTTNGGTGTSSDNAGASSGAGTGTRTGGTPTSTGTAPSATPTTGGQGTLLTFEDGTTMTYDNTFGGQWVWDAANPFNNNARPNSWTPPLNQSWTWGRDKVFGVNLGGWFVTEPFIVTSLYEIYASGPAGTAVDEYTLSQNMGSNLTNAMTDHYKNFITERDIAEIAMAGLNWVRIPIGHWMVAKLDGEPYLERVSWNYFLKAVQWCRKYGIRIKLDLHTMPGSQNGWNHSGKIGSINWMNGPMGLANAQRGLDVIRTLAQFISQPEYANVIPLFGFINEPNGLQLNKQILGSFYLEAHKIIREVTGFGEGKGPWISIHDGFLGTSTWTGFGVGADRMALDQHPYMAFQDQQTGPLSGIQKIPCQWWATGTNTTSQQFGANVAGEWSVAINDCGKWLNRVGAGSRYDNTMDGYTGPNAGAGACDYYNDYTQWTAATKSALNHVALGSMDALQNWFFWTWKIGDSTGPIAAVNPMWHYRLGLQNGWIPKDPRTAAGTCQADGVSGNNFGGTFSSAYMTGGAGAGTLAAGQTQSYPWPPASFTNVPAASMALLPQYTQSANPVTMPGPSYTSPGSSATIDSGNGWFNANDNRKAFAPIAGCAYPPEYSAADLAVTRGACGAGLTQTMKRASMPQRTAMAA